jgi:antibiotic biosynthesis monooxygenase (ABM) superfamily enzyme
MLDGVPVSSQSRASAREIIERTVLLKSSEHLGQSRDQGRKENGTSAWLTLHL